MIELILWTIVLVSFIVIIIPVVSFTRNISISGLVSVSESSNFRDNIGVQANPSVPAAQPATLTTRTNNTTGTLTMTNSNHGIITGQRIDLYWATGQCYGAIAGTVNTTSVPIASVVGGSNLPTQGTSINVGICTSAPFNLTGDNLTALALYAPQLGYFALNTASAEIVAELVQANRVFTWATNDSTTNPLAGATPTKIWLSHNSTTAAVTTMLAAAASH